MPGWATQTLTPGLCFSFKPFNHSHKVAKFCYADKVSSSHFICSSGTVREASADPAKLS